MFFDADDYLRLRDRVAAGGCDVPILAARDAGRRRSPPSSAPNSSPAPRSRPHWRARFEEIRDDEDAVRRLGMEEASALCARLLDEGVPGIHFITFNRSTATREVWSNLSLGART